MNEKKPGRPEGFTGRPAKVLLRTDIERAMRATRSNRAAAVYLHVSYPTYRKYAQLYKDENGVTLYDKHKNPSGKGIRKFAANLTADGGKFTKARPLLDILEGRASAASHNPQQLKYKLIVQGYLEPKCAKCGFDKQRILDGKYPLILRHKDGDDHNWNLDNLEFICYNCAFLNGPNIISDEIVQVLEKGVQYGLQKEKREIEETFELDPYQKSVLKHLMGDE